MTYFEINKQDIIHNYEELSHITQALVIPTLKANAYGMGAKEVACLLRDHCGVNLFAVSRLEEAQDMPCGGGVRTLVLSAYYDDESIRKLVDGDLIMAVDSISQARRIADRVLYFHKGKLLESGPKEQVLYTPSMAETKQFLEFYGN